MNRRRKRIMIAYLLRTFVALVGFVCVILMICGCLYIHEHLHPQQVQAALDTFSEQVDDTVSDVFSSVTDNIQVTTPQHTIVLDPGHGGKDQGTCNRNMLEKDINLSVALQMKDLLEAQGFHVIMTRDTDDFITLEDRSWIANSNQVDLFVSVHCNYCEGSSEINGFECYYLNDASSGKSYADDIVNYLTGSTTIETRGTKQDDFYVLRNTIPPAVLLELGYMSNRYECDQLVDPSYQQLLSEEIVNAIVQSFSYRMT